MIHYENVDDLLAERKTWKAELTALRAIMLEAGLEETVKWGQACYTDQGKNVVILGTRKEHAVASFFKGALIDEPQGRFVRPGMERSGRYLPYASPAAVEADREYLLALVAKAVEAERAGLKVPPLPDEIEYIDELAEHMAADEAFAEAFEALTPGRQRQYNMHFGKAKQSSTRVSRIEAATERIMAGKGLLDCICGHSKRMPRCDGSHRDHA